MGKKVVNEGFGTERKLPAPDEFRSGAIRSSRDKVVNLVMTYYGPEIAGEQAEMHPDAQAAARHDALQGHLTKTGTVDFIPQQPQVTDTRVENTNIAGTFSPSSVSVASLIQSTPEAHLSSNGYTG